MLIKVPTSCETKDSFVFIGVFLSGYYVLDKFSHTYLGSVSRWLYQNGYEGSFLKSFSTFMTYSYPFPLSFLAISFIVGLVFLGRFSPVVICSLLLATLLSLYGTLKVYWIGEPSAILTYHAWSALQRIPNTVFYAVLFNLLVRVLVNYRNRRIVGPLIGTEVKNG